LLSHPPTNVETGARDQVLHLGNGAEPQSIDPHFATSVGAHNILSSLLEGLMEADPMTLEPIPGVAESWDISEDQRVYTFHLRENARWSNGDPVTEHGLEYSCRRMLNPDWLRNMATCYMCSIMPNSTMKAASVMGKGL